MLDGRVLGASQVEYKPFGKPPLKREIQHTWPAAPPAWQRSLPGRATCPALKPRQAAEPSLSPGSLLYALNCFNMSEYMSDEQVRHPAAPARHRSHTPARRVIRIIRIIRSYGHTAAWHCATLPRQAAEPPLSPGSLLYALNFNMSDYMSDEHVLATPGAPPCRATCPASEPCRARAKGFPGKKFKDCLLQSCCHPRIEGNSTRNSTRGNSEKMGHACFQFRTPRGQQPKNGCLFPVPRHFESISATYAFQHHIPARHRRLRYLARQARS